MAAKKQPKDPLEQAVEKVSRQLAAATGRRERSRAQLAADELEVKDLAKRQADLIDGKLDPQDILRVDQPQVRSNGHVTVTA